MTAKDLKNALLQEAVQGKLVPQIASEGNARDLLEEIRRERLSHGLDLRLEASLAINAKSGKRKSKKETALAGSNPCDITEEEIPFDIPESWCWCRLGELAEIITKGSSPSWQGINYVDEGILFVTSENVGDEELLLSKRKFLEQKFNEIQPRSILQKGDILTNIVGASIGRTAIFDLDIKNANINQAVALIRLKNKQLNSYIVKVLNSKTIIDQMTDNTVNTARANISLTTVENFKIPLPPLAEQKRIVAAIEKFMPLIEEYDKKETQLKAINEKIGALTKKAILQEAVQGKLVPQIASEGNARDLLEEIRKEKLSHGLDFANAKSGKRKSKKETALAGSNPCDITEEEIPFDIPENWCWCRLSEYLDIRDGTHDSPKFYDNGIPFVTSKNLNDGILDFSTCKYITEEDHKKFSARSFVEDGDILFAMIGSIGNPVIVKKKFDFSFKNMALFKRYTKEKTDMKYIFYYLSYIQFELKRIATGGVQSFIGLGTFREMLFPLPPLAEQKRIVAAIEKMLPLCEKLGE